MQVCNELEQRDRELAALREENARARSEASRLRRELNAAHAQRGESMMDVAMAASVQALHEEAEHQRRLAQEQAILCDEVTRGRTLPAPGASRDLPHASTSPGLSPPPVRAGAVLTTASEHRAAPRLERAAR